MTADDLSNDDFYASGALNRALDPATQPPEIQALLRAEIDWLREFIAPGTRVVDIGCGTGRHLIGLRDRLRLGLGLDYERGYIAQAQRRAGAGQLHFIVSDATAIPVAAEFDRAICTTNTWGTMSDKAGVLREMRRLAPRSGTRLLVVYSPASIPARRAWSPRLGNAVLEETPEYLVSGGGFRSEHFTPERLRQLVGMCEVRPLTEIAYAVTF